MIEHELSLRVSVATLDRVIFQSPRDGTLMLALERKATLLEDANRRSVTVRAQPFGGAVRLRNLVALRDLIGDFLFDSERSRSEQDFRILIRPADWGLVKRFCLQHLQNADDPVLESDPIRELVEEFGETLQVNLQPNQYSYQPVGFIVEDKATPTDNIYSRGVATVRLYRIFQVNILDEALCLAMLETSERYSDAALQSLALKNAQNAGRGRANTVLTLPLNLIRDFYLTLLPEQRYALRSVEDHPLDPSVLAILEGVEVPRFQWL